jgi:hypothetical protein
VVAGEQQVRLLVVRAALLLAGMVAVLAEQVVRQILLLRAVAVVRAAIPVLAALEVVQVLAVLLVQEAVQEAGRLVALGIPQERVVAQGFTGRVPTGKGVFILGQTEVAVRGVRVVQREEGQQRKPRMAQAIYLLPAFPEAALPDQKAGL